MSNENDVRPDENASEEAQPVYQYKAGKKLTVEEYKNLDENDDSLKRWKESLGLGSGNTICNPADSRTVIIKRLSCIPVDHEAIHIDLTSEGALENLKKSSFTIKENTVFRLEVAFQVQHQILAGLKYTQETSRLGLSQTTEQMIGSYSPNTEGTPEYIKTFNSETAPSGMLGRGKYKAISKFVDDDNDVHLSFQWSFEVKKDW